MRTVSLSSSSMKYDSRPLSEVMRSTSLPRAGTIPACAGSTVESVSGCTSRQGSSPHMRGALDGVAAAPAGVGIIPACAGSTSRTGCWTCPCWDHPRMCGEHREGTGVPSCRSGSSPHVRGAPGLRTCSSRCCRDHPRMCGEHLHCCSFLERL